MVLVTRCTHCETCFRVVLDQLKLRGGLVRCGTCRKVFSGLEHLRSIEDPAQQGAEPDYGPEDYAPWRTRIDPLPTVPGNVDGEVDASDEGAGAGQSADSAAGDGGGDYDGDGDGERAKAAFARGWPRPGVHDLIAVALVLGLAVQAVVAGRHWLSARFPALEPLVAAASAPFGLDIQLPRSLETLSLQFFDLQPVGAARLLSASAVLRNDAHYAVRWPSMLVTLMGSGKEVLVQRIIDPEEYLGGGAHAPLRAQSERKLRFALQTDGFAPSGHSVLLFYR
jgi:predicted Zn finger-like uncharacterized protein